MYFLAMVILFIFLCNKPSYSQSQVHSIFGNGIQFSAKDSSFYMKMGTRFQTLYEGELGLIDGGWNERFLIRRARLKFDGFVYHPTLEYKIELGLSNQDIGGGDLRQNNNANNIILDAVLKWNFYKKFTLWFGQAKLPGNRERVISSRDLQFVDRSFLNSYFTLDRDAGIQLHHWFKIQNVVFRQIGSISMGEGRDVTVNNAGGRDYTVRLEILPFGEFENDGDYVGGDLSREEKPKLAVGITYDQNNGASKEGGQLGRYLDAERDLKTLFIDGMFKYRGSSLMFEYANKVAPAGPVVEIDTNGEVLQAYDTGEGVNFQAGYLFKNNIEIAGRYAYVNPDNETQGSDNEEFTLAVSKYIVGHNLKVQSDVALIQADTGQDHVRFRLQVEMAL